MFSVATCYTAVAQAGEKILLTRGTPKKTFYFHSAFVDSLELHLPHYLQCTVWPLPLSLRNLTGFLVRPERKPTNPSSSVVFAPSWWCNHEALGVYCSARGFSNAAPPTSLDGNKIEVSSALRLIRPSNQRGLSPRT